MKTIHFIKTMSFFSIIALGYGAYHISFHVKRLEEAVTSLKLNATPYNNGLKQSLSTIDQAAIISQSWQKLQQTLQNTVVQFHVTSGEHHILQPYRVPQPSQSCGSGFFISQDGEIITNAHVVNGATAIMIQIPAFGKHQFEVDLIGLMPEKDFAMVKVRPMDLETIINRLGKVPVLLLGDSDEVMRSQEILALGYPLGQQSLKSTTGVVSGRESGMIQISAAINPGSSGGPSLDSCGKVIGINTSGVVAAQNVGYIMPINDVKVFLKDVRAGGLVRKPYLGIYQFMATPDLLKALENPLPGGVYVSGVLEDSPLKGQLQIGDMIYEINDIAVDMYGEMSVPWSEDKISTAEYVSRMPAGQKIDLTVYRKGEKKQFTCNLERKKLAPIRQMFTEYEELSYEAFGGYIIMPLMLNHLPHLIPVSPSLTKYAEDKMQAEPALVITHVLPDSPAYKDRIRIVGSIIKKLNGIEVKTLEQLREALLKSGDIITLETSENILVALAKDRVIKAESVLAHATGYDITAGMQALIAKQSGTTLVSHSV